MKQKQVIKKSASIILYAIVLFYLLPFRPLYIFYNYSHFNTTGECYEQSNNVLITSDNSLALTSEIHLNKDTFPKKDKIRFYFDSFFIVSPDCNKVASTTKEEIVPYLHYIYHNPLVNCNSGRGPPIV
jgi:hypothetical protein